MHIIVEKTAQSFDRDFTGTAAALLDELKINPVTVIIAADGALIPLETDISKSKQIHILTIVSGG